MRVVIQRVTEASLSIDHQIYSVINKGLVVLVGVGDQDSIDDIKWLVQKISNLRIFSDSEGKMNLSVKDIEGDVLLVSQFTLFASTKKGTRPSFTKSARPEIAIPLYETFIQAFQTVMGTDKVQTGVFGANMKINLVNDGPVTISIDSKNRE